MQKLFKSCYAMDKKCYDEYGLTEDILMEHAAMGMERYIRDRFPVGTSVLIVAGPGNNGADGIVLARLLHGEYDIQLLIPFGVASPMAKLQLERAHHLGITEAHGLSDADADADVIVDALFGAGLSRELDEPTQEIIVKLNEFDGHKVACDVPTGIAESGQLLPMAFRADATLTMGARKESLYLDEAKDYVGKVHCIDLGVSGRFYEDVSQTYLLEAEDLRLPIREQKSSHKGNFGHATVFTGEKEGAGIIAGMAATRYGAGLTTLVVHEPIMPQSHLMHATIMPEAATAIAIGMGLGSYFDDDFLERHVIDTSLPIILDADALHSSKLLGILEQKEREIVITPHPKEFASLWKILTGETLSVSEIQAKRFEVARRFSDTYPRVTLLLKGANTIIARSGELFVNPLGSARLSKGGSGDVLSGLIVSLLAQGCSAKEAAIQGSLALTLAAQSYQGADYAMLSTDLINQLSSLGGEHEKAR